jgi:hypothetical protein
MSEIAKMSKRLQVLLDESELKEIQRIARARPVTVAQWVRETLSAARRQAPRRDSGRKIEVVRAASRLSYPTGDIEELLSQIEKGYLDKSRR